MKHALKRFIYSTLLMGAFSILGHADIACGVATLSTYDASGFSCSDGPLDFSHFTFSSTGTILPPDLSITVTPLANGLFFNGNGALSAPASHHDHGVVL